MQLGLLELHPWGSREDKLERPDRMVFDLDPGPEAPWKSVIDGASRLKECLDELELKSFLKTTGGKGLHVVVPLVRRLGWDDLKEFSKSIADRIVKEDPERYIATASKAKRKGKVFVDYLRNSRGATAVAPYSTRARPGAPVAVPLAWDELSAKLKSDQYSIETLPQRLNQLKQDPWSSFFKVQQSITKEMKEKIESLEE